jgi:hypothetical protein
MLRSLLIAAVLVSTLGVSACNSGNKEQQPTADEQKRIQDEQQKAAEQQRQLTNGMGQTMSEPPAGSEAYKRLHSKQGKKGNAAPSNSQDQQPPKPANDSPQQ